MSSLAMDLAVYAESSSSSSSFFLHGLVLASDLACLFIEWIRDCS